MRLLAKLAGVTMFLLVAFSAVGVGTIIALPTSALANPGGHDGED